MAQFKIKWTEKSKLEKREILQFYINRNGNSIYSKKLNLIFKIGISRISKNPFIGIESDFDFTRSYITMDYEIIYSILSDNLILIDSIWDCRQNPNDKRVGRRIR